MANYVAVQITAPQAEGDTGASAEAWYVVEGNEVVLTDRDGVALFDGSGKKYTATLAPGESAKRVAGRFVRRLHDATHGRRTRGFTGPIFYPRMKNA
jgi:hypothetical protein